MNKGLARGKKQVTGKLNSIHCPHDRRHTAPPNVPVGQNRDYLDRFGALGAARARTPVLRLHCASERDVHPHLISAKRTRPPGAAAYNGNDRQRWPPALMVAGVRGACDGGDEKSRESGFRRLKAGLRENGCPDKFGFLPHAPAGVLISTVSCLARCPPGILRPSVPHRPAPSRPRV